MVFRYWPPDPAREAGVPDSAAVALAATAEFAAPAALAGVPPAVADPWRLWPEDAADPPITATEAMPAVWSVREIDGAAAGDPRRWAAPAIFEAVMATDRREAGGGESIRSGQELTSTRAVIEVRAENLAAIAGADFSARDWELRDLATGERWDILSSSRSWERGRTVELIAESRR